MAPAGRLAIDGPATGTVQSCSRRAVAVRDIDDVAVGMGCKPIQISGVVTTECADVPMLRHRSPQPGSPNPTRTVEEYRRALRQILEITAQGDRSVHPR